MARTHRGFLVLGVEELKERAKVVLGGSCWVKAEQAKG